MARVTKSSVVSALCNNPTDRTIMALYFARICFEQRPDAVHPEPIFACFALTMGYSEGNESGYDPGTAQGYVRFVEFVCDIWQLMIFGLAE